MNSEPVGHSSLPLWLALAALNGLLAVGAGAFGAHGVADPQTKEWLRTGAQYQALHAAAALGVFALVGRVGRAGWIGWLFGVGALVFGASLYLLALTGVRAWGAVTPLGGLLLLAGWAGLLWAALTGRGVA